MTFFEVKQTRNHSQLLATSNGDLNWKSSDNTPDFYIEQPKGCSLENIKWSQNSDTLFATCYNEKKKKQYICKYSF